MNDKRWIRAIRQGDTAAFEQLYGAYKQSVYRYALSLSGSVADADDLLQEAFMGLLRNIDRVDGARPVLPYLLKSVRNRHVDRLRSFAERRQPLPDDPVSASPGAAAVLEKGEQRGQVLAAVGALSEAQAEVVRLRLYGELSYDSIAEQLRVPAATIRNRYRAALERLREILGRSARDV